MSKDSVPNDDLERNDTEQNDGAKGPAPDPFDPESLRLSQDFASTAGVKKVLTTVPCRKPHRQEFVRVRPGEEWRLETAAFEDKIQRETYLVERTLWSEMAGEVYPVRLFLTVNRQNDVFMWPAKLPGPDGRSNHWNDSALEAARLAETRWIRVASNTSAGLYDTFEASGELSDPVWPELPFRKILELCLRGRLIQDIDHPVLEALRGES